MVWSIINNVGRRVGVLEASEEQHIITCSCGCPKSWTLPQNLSTARQLHTLAETLGFSATLDQHSMLVQIRLCATSNVDRVLEALKKKPDLMRLVYLRLHQIYWRQPATTIAVNQTDEDKLLSGLGLIVPASGSVVLSDYANDDQIWRDSSLQTFLDVGDIKIEVK